MIIKEFRIVLPLSLDEYQIAQLYSVAEASKNETGGGEGIEVVENHPFENEEYGKGQYTYKNYFLASRVPGFLKLFAPKGLLEFEEEAHNAFPYCKTVVTNSKYMKEKFLLSIETIHKVDFGESENVHKLEPSVWKKTEVIRIDIANDPVSSSDYKEDEDPKKFKPKGDAAGRGPLSKDWIQKLKSRAEEYENCEPNKRPYMCAYKLVRINFKWTGFQTMVEKFTQRQERRIFCNFNRQVYCWMNHWSCLTMDDIREIEEKTQEELSKMRKTGSIKGTKVNE